VRRRFILTSGHIEIGDATVVQNAKRVESFERDIDASIGGRGGIEENVLLSDEGAHLLKAVMQKTNELSKRWSFADCAYHELKSKAHLGNVF